MANQENFLDKDGAAPNWVGGKGIIGDIKLTVLAAGLGRRMEPLTVNHLPKPMFPIGGCVPMAEQWVSRAVKSGITDISMNLCVLGNTIKNHFRDGSAFGPSIDYVEEDTPSGTLGGVCKQALGKTARGVYPSESMPLTDKFNGTTIVAPSGDIITDFNAQLLEQLYDIHKQKGAAFTMVLTPIPWEKRGEFGTVELQNIETLDGSISRAGQIVNFREKDPNSPSNLNNASIYMIEREFLEVLDQFRTTADPNLDKPFYDFGKHVFPAMLGNLDYIKLPGDFPLWGVEYDGVWFDVGRKRDYLGVNKSLLDGEFTLDLPYEQVPWGFRGTHVQMDEASVKIHPPVIVGNNCKVEPGATLGPYAVIGDDWTIGADAVIRNSVLWPRYDFYTTDGTQITVEERKNLDLHCVQKGICIDESIVVGGTINSNLKENIANVNRDGSVDILSIDYVPGGKRA